MNSKIYFMLITPILFMLLISSCSNKEKALKESQIHYRMALDLDIKGESTQALAEALKAEKMNPKDPDVHNLLGLIFTRKNLFDRAEHHLKEAVKLNPEYSEARNNMAFLYIKQNRYDEAIEQATKAVENITYGSPERAYNNIGWAYYKKGDLENASENFKRSLMHNRDFFLAHWNMARIYFETGKYDRAREAYEKSIKSCKECADLYYDLGMTHLKLKDKKSALKSFEECVNLSKEDSLKDKCSGKIAILK